MAELLIRPIHNDHLAVANLLIPPARAGLASVRRPISRLVVNAQLAISQRQYRETAAEAIGCCVLEPKPDSARAAYSPSAPADAPPSA